MSKKVNQDVPIGDEDFVEEDKEEQTEDSLEFECELKRVPVKLKINGVFENYFLQELMGSERDTYMNTYAKRLRFVDGQPVGMTDYTDCNAGLIARCLRKEDDETLMPLSEVKKLPARVQLALFKKCNELSGLQLAVAKETAGN